MLQAWVVWSMCNLENKIISVERILQYMSIPAEPPLSVQDDKLTQDWPSEGEIMLNNVHVIAHSSYPPILFINIFPFLNKLHRFPLPIR
jgi:hypothetical protein